MATAMSKPVEEITRAEFEAYESVRAGGRWNMFSLNAQFATRLDRETYFSVLKNYEVLAQKWPDVRKKEGQR